ncbi:internalin [Bifidobacterium pseudolongum subsp. globosum]|uniref:Internalin n=1 Tax=Bifidobacterium pseudolongum subsp. globosum TaxID=1690 RepID=A0A4V1Y1T3_9BIFI|nr:S-layer homology domain-containing protein [Bifidobacterium pseudolongum]RYQ10969.1 internalin [Bifidobacterium pseudolongum subsp. globosum]
MRVFKRFAAGMVAAGMALAMLPVAAAQADDGYDWSHPITISDVQVTAVTDTTADVTFKYAFDEAKFKKLLPDAKITRVCFIVNVDKILTMKPEQRFYESSWATGRDPYDDDPKLCADMVGDDVATPEQEQEFYSLKTVPLTMTMGNKAYTEATLTAYSFLRGDSLTGNELKKAGTASVHLKGLQPNMWYGNKNVPQKNEDEYIYPMSSGSLARWLLFREKLREIAQPGAFDQVMEYDDTCWTSNDTKEPCKQKRKYALNKNYGQPINIDMNQLFIGAHIDYDEYYDGVKYGDYFSVYGDAVQVPSFTTKPKASGSTVAFTDVNSKTPHADDIRWLAENKISEGYKNANGTYRFEGMTPVYRQDMAAFLRREAANRDIADAASWKPSAADRTRFRDVTCTADNKGNRNTPHCEDILWLAHAGISEGWKEKDGSSTFRGMDTVKRQDMAAFLKRLAAKAGKGGNVKPKTDFTDVFADTPHKAEIQWLGGSGISEGYRNANGTWRFEGMTSVYRQDMAAFIHRLDNLIAK